MSDTPISDSTAHNVADLGMLCRRLERQINTANVEIERLTAKVAQLREGAEEQKQRIHSLIAERDTARLQSDQKHSLREEFRELLGTDDIEQGVSVVREMKQRIKRLEEAGDYLCAAAAFMGWHDKIETWNKAKEAKP